MIKRSAVTLIEAVLTILIGSILFIALTKIFSSGLMISQKGTSHLTNVQAASILMNQIEKDISLSTNFSAEGDGFSCTIIDDFGAKCQMALATVKYQTFPDNIGITRTQDSSGDKDRNHVFCEGLLVHVKWEKVQIPQNQKTGFFVEISTSKPPSGTEKNTLRRFIYCYNLETNRQKITKSWQW